MWWKSLDYKSQHNNKKWQQVCDETTHSLFVATFLSEFFSILNLLVFIIFVSGNLDQTSIKRSKLAFSTTDLFATTAGRAS